MDVLAIVDDVTEVDTDAKIEAAFSEALLHFDATFDGFVHSGKFG